MIYFTADTHFCHFNVIKLCKRPFSTIEEMHNTLIQNWNTVVNKKDEIYILGDFLYKGNGIKANEILQQLNGRKYLLKGNHDQFITEKSFDKSNFEWIKDYFVLNYQKKKIVLFHYPIFEWDGYFKGAIHLYGHVHNNRNDVEQQNEFTVLGKMAINVGVDVNNFTPIDIQTIFKMTE